MVGFTVAHIAPARTITEGATCVCEMLAAAYPRPQPYALLHDAASSLERYGLGGFGWGVAWLEENGHGDVRVCVERGLGCYVDEAAGHERLQAASSRRFLIHLRRPNRLSTIQLADTQPFLHTAADTDDFAWCHNGFLDRAEALRPPYGDRLAGAADSEVGWVFFQDRLGDGATPEEALHEVDETFGGKINLGYLDAGGRLGLYANNVSNAMWRFESAGADMVSTALHSDDDSVFALVYADSTDPRLVPTGTAVWLGADGAGRDN